MNKYPSFQLQNGREPLPGIDYDPDGSLCQDDYEYFSGTGAYTNDPEEVNASENPLYRGARIYYTGDRANIEGEGTIARVNKDGRFYPLTYDIKMDDGREFLQVLPNSFDDSPGRRFWPFDQWRAKRQAEIKAFQEKYHLAPKDPPPNPLPSRYALRDETMCFECGADIATGHYYTCSQSEKISVGHNPPNEN